MTLSRLLRALSLPDFDLWAARRWMAPRPRPLRRPADRRGPPREGAVLALLYPRNGELHLLLTERTLHLNDHAGQIAFPGGRRESGEPLPLTALREAREEVGLDPDPVRLLGHLPPLFIPPTDFEITCFVAYVPRRPALRPHPREVARLLEVPLAAFFEPAVRKVADRTPDGRRMTVPYFDVGAFVWGATAILIGELVARLRAVGGPPPRPPEGGISWRDLGPTGGGLLELFRVLLGAYGPQGWWPGDGPLEVALGAILTQGTAWTNVERALARLRARVGDLEDLAALRALSEGELAEAIRPAGYFRVKARRLRAFLDALDRDLEGEIGRLRRLPLEEARPWLLSIPGIGPETADSILLYAADRPTFVVDAYTRRLLACLGWLPADGYEAVRAFFQDRLPADPPLFNEYHALIVAHAKERCRKGAPRCADCPLREGCAYGRGER